MALAAVWGTPGLPRPTEGGGSVMKIRSALPKWLWLQSGALLGSPGHSRYRKEIAVQLSSNLRIKILIRSLAISGSLKTLFKGPYKPSRKVCLWAVSYIWDIFLKLFGSLWCYFFETVWELSMKLNAFEWEIWKMFDLNGNLLNNQKYVFKDF